MVEKSEPGSPGDAVGATNMMRLVEGLEVDTADGRAGIMTLLREIEASAPGSLKRLAADLQMRRAARAMPGTLASVQ